MKQVIKCGHLFDVNEKAFKAQANVYIDGNVIEKVVYGEDQTEEGWEIVDLTGKYVMPGFIDCHVHLNMDGEPDGTASMSSATDGDMALKLTCTP